MLHLIYLQEAETRLLSALPSLSAATPHEAPLRVEQSCERFSTVVSREDTQPWEVEVIKTVLLSKDSWVNEATKVPAALGNSMYWPRLFCVSP